MEGIKISRETVEDRIKNGYNIDLGSIISRSINLLKDDLGFFIMLGLLVTFLSFFFAITFVGIFFINVLIVGAVYVTHKKIRKQPVEVSDIFVPFKTNKLWPLVIYTIINFLFIVPIMAIFSLAVVPIMIDPESENMGALAGGLMILSYLFIIIAAIFISTCLFYAPYLIAFGDYSPVEAIKTSFKLGKKKFWMLFLTTLVIGLIAQAGTIACYIGIIVTMPITYIGYAYIVEDVLLTNQKNEIDQIGLE